MLGAPSKKPANTMPPMADYSEGAFQKDVIHVAALNGWDAHHIRPGLYGGGHYRTDGLKGMPDLILIGRHGQGILWAELKTEKGKVSEIQHERMAQLLNNGQEVYVWRPSQMQLIVDRLAAWKN